MKFTGKIIVSDIDGTYTGSQRGVARNNDAIRYFCENGGLFTFATGRVEYNIGTIVPLYRELINAPAVFCNGSYLYDLEASKRINEICLDGHVVMPFIKQVQDVFPDLGIRINYGDSYLTTRYNEMIYGELRNYFSEVKETPYGQMPLDGWNKIVIAGDGALLERATHYIREHMPQPLELSMSCGTLLELLAPGATKGNQVLYLKRLLGEVTAYCIGDYENDEDMLKKADVSACPCSGLKKIVDMADIVTPHCEEGAIAGLIEQIEASL